ncbi:MAG: CDF family Co(II)/Ni(II) efflux transporter DmeF [Desulfosarcinaceae bacterium]|nr:CDF family Co(II)/Ni(II) efflux transporter DmeF [Desulfosarcinaceae bacterium]
MHIHHLKQWTHEHRYNDADRHAERQTWRVIALTTVMMVVEIAAGYRFGSMALLADGWHMGTHAAALGITVFAYWYARKHRNNLAFTFGTGKVGVLGGFASAVALAVVALFMVVESVERLVSPVRIDFNEAILVAGVGLVVNLVSALMLHRGGGHAHAHDHDGEHDHPHADHNLKAAFLHVLADALTSFLAILALLVGKFWGLEWFDPLMGIVGAVLIANWARGLIRTTSRILLDSDVSETLLGEIQAAIEADRDNRVTDLHLWKIDSDHYAALITLVTHYPQPAAHYRALLADYPRIRHVTVEINAAPGEPCVDVPGASTTC